MKRKIMLFMSLLMVGWLVSSCGVCSAPKKAGIIELTYESNSVAVGNSITMWLTLSGSYNVSDITVYLTSSSGDVTISPAVCHLSTTHNTCKITITGVSVGFTTINASSPNGYTVQPTVVTVKPAFAYIANSGDNTISICSITESSGALSLCAESDLGGLLNKPISITSANGYMYIANSSTLLTTCKFTNNVISDCSNSPPGYSTLFYGGVSTYNGYLYTVNYGSDVSPATASSIFNCLITQGSTLDPCNNIFSASGISNGVNGELTFTNTHAYVANYDNNYVDVCTIGSAGDLSNCSITGNNMPHPVGMVINANNTFAYVIESTHVTLCAISPSTGMLDACVIDPDTFTSLQSKSRDSVSSTGDVTNPAIYNNVLYVPNDSTNNVAICSIESDGLISNCTVAGVEAGIKAGSAPQGIYIPTP